MKKYLLLAGAAIVLLCSCVPSVNPFYTEKDVVTDSRLPGTWREVGNDKPSVWKFEVGETNAYILTVTENDGKTGEFNTHLFKLGKEHFLDLIPAECNYATNQADLLNAAMIPGHLLVRVSLGESKMHLALCDADWLGKYLKRYPSALAHRDEDGGIVLTARTSALQKFILKHLGKGELFSEGGDMERVADNVPAAPK